MRRSLALLALAPAVAAAEPSDQEIGARLGTRLNLGGLGNGGVLLGGAFLYRVSDSVWFDTQAQITVGGGGKDCYLGRQRDVVCDPSLASGAGAMVLTGPRYFFPDRGAFTPHLGGGLGIGYAAFSADELSGVAFPAWVGGGVRARLRDGITVGGELVLSGGPAHFGRDQGWRPFVALGVVGTLDFGL